MSDLKAALADRYHIEFRHHRKVAIKVLRPELAVVIGAARFLKGIETTANLQLPHMAQAGDVDAALDEIERLLTRPSWLRVHTLRLDPRWGPIREHPRFKALLARYTGAASP